MPTAAPHLEQFVRAVHRKFVLVRVLEQAGTGALAGCAAAGVLLPLLLWKGEPALLPAAALIAMGAGVGLTCGVVRRPSRLAAAMEADRQLGLRDLLSTAATVDTAAAPDPWLFTVLAVADDRCRRHTPSQVVLRRYGSRAWGGIGLAASLVLTLAALLSAPGTTPVVASRGLIANAGGATSNPIAAIDPSAPLVSRSAPGALASRSHESRTVDPVSEEQSARPGADQAPSNEATSSSGGRSRESGRDGQGGGAGTIGNRRATLPGDQARSFPRPVASPQGDVQPNGTPAGGGAEAADSASGTDPDAGGGVSSAIGSPARAAPWESSTWPADARAARQAVESGRVPDAYRDLVREYFER